LEGLEIPSGTLRLQKKTQGFLSLVNYNVVLLEFGPLFDSSPYFNAGLSASKLCKALKCMNTKTTAWLWDVDYAYLRALAIIGLGDIGSPADTGLDSTLRPASTSCPASDTEGPISTGPALCTLQCYKPIGVLIRTENRPAVDPASVVEPNGRVPRHALRVSLLDGGHSRPRRGSRRRPPQPPTAAQH
jgi:hypothetical protein